MLRNITVARVFLTSCCLLPPCAVQAQVFATSDLPAAVTLQLSVSVIRVDLPPPTANICSDLAAVTSKRSLYIWGNGLTRAGRAKGEDTVDTGLPAGSQGEQFFDDGLMHSLEVKRGWFEVQPFSSALLWAFNTKDVLGARSGCSPRQCFIVVRASYTEPCGRGRAAAVAGAAVAGAVAPSAGAGVAAGDEQDGAGVGGQHGTHGTDAATSGSSGSSSSCGPLDQASLEHRLLLQKGGANSSMGQLDLGLHPSVLASALCAHCAAAREQAEREAAWAAALITHATLRAAPPSMQNATTRADAALLSAGVLLGPSPSLLAPHDQPQPKLWRPVYTSESGGLGWAEVVVTLQKMKHMNLMPPNITVYDFEELRLGLQAEGGSLHEAQAAAAAPKPSDPTAGLLKGASGASQGSVPHDSPGSTARARIQYGSTAAQGSSTPLPTWGVCFTASAQATALHMVFISRLDGWFSDNAVLLLPCAPRRLCFWLWEYPPGYAADAAATGGGAGQSSSSTGAGKDGASSMNAHPGTAGTGTGPGAMQQLHAGPPPQSVAEVCGWKVGQDAGEEDSSHRSLLECFERTLTWESAYN